MPGSGGVRKSTNSRMQLLEIRKMPTTFEATGWDGCAGRCEENPFLQGVSGIPGYANFHLDVSARDSPSPAVL
jgi:hypothetical protein